MFKKAKMMVMAVAAVLCMATVAGATPSTQIWIPSTDVQAFKTVHLGLDAYIRVAKENTTSPLAPSAYLSPVYDAGVTAGVLPFEKVQMEVGIDYITGGTNPQSYPMYFNAKLATPEGALFKGSPALAIGGYNLGVSHVNNYNLAYALAAKTLPYVGRISAGYYTGNNRLLKDDHGKTDAQGVLVSWDRTMTEIDDRLWMAVDYQGGDNAFGALSVGASWAFSKNVSVIVGYDIYNTQATGGKPTVTAQVDINFP